VKGVLLLAVATLAGICMAAAGRTLDDPMPCEAAPRKESAEGCGGMSYAEWLRFDPVQDQRPWWQRLRFSFFGEVGIDKAKLKLDREAAKFSGTYRDGEQPKPEVNSLAGGIKVEGQY